MVGAVRTRPGVLPAAAVRDDALRVVDEQREGPATGTALIIRGIFRQLLQKTGLVPAFAGEFDGEGWREFMGDVQ